MHLQLRNIGQINDADIRFGDLTVFVGPQASGKSIALQFLKLVLDMGYVQEEMRRYGIDWSGKYTDFFDTYFGEGMYTIWRHDESEVRWGNHTIPLMQWIKRKRSTKAESVFFIPAQRVLTLRDGWPRPFTDFKPGDPFVVREFSEKVRVLIEHELCRTESAIDVLLLMVLELIARGYRVCLSTHSPQVLEAVWALRHLKENGESALALLEMFDAPQTEAMIKLAQTVMAKNVAVHYFDPTSGRTKDISELDPDSEAAGESGWGGLTEFSGRANAVVARAVANARQGKTE
jgi:hypothetical protein